MLTGLRFRGWVPWRKKKIHREVIFVEVKNEEAMLDFVQDEISGTASLKTYRKFYQGQ